MSICNRLLIIKLVLFWGGEVIGVVMVCEQGSAIGSVAGLRWGYVLRVILVSIWTLSCITTTTVNIGRKTSLERQLMGRFEPLTEEEIINSAQNSLSISRKDQEIVQNIVPQNYIAISLGGEWKYKTYQKWSEVINQLLLDNKNIKIIFVGSKNALRTSKQLLNIFPKDQLLDFTSILSFNQTAEVIRKSEVFLCCDGGLMHAATALNAKIVSLFARLTPEMLLPKNTNLYSLYDQENVNNIRPSKVISKYNEAINSAENHL